MKRIHDVACIVVTFNRLPLLKKCLNSIRNQTNKDFDIIVVNNGSTDGTKEWLDGQENLIVINQSNVGGAGGFFSGMKKAYEDGYEWVWMMDDDGIADSSQLEALKGGAYKFNSLFLNALVCNIADHDNLAFGLSHDRKIIKSTKEAQKYEVISGAINPFNGTFVNRRVIETIGYIKKEMFIWGDEREYELRAKSAGYKIYTVTNAIHFHPRGKVQKKNVIPFFPKIQIFVPSNERMRVCYRNDGFIYKTYMPLIEQMKIKILYSTYYLSRLNFVGLFKYHMYYHRGANNCFE